jgi:hypothetical protein
MATPKKPKPAKAQAQAKPVIYVELAPHLEYIKTRLEGLARAHNRKLSGEVVQALQEYLARHPEGEDEREVS